MKKIGISLLMAIILFLEPLSLMGQQQDVSDPPVQTEAPSVMLMEISTGKVLYEKNAQEQRSPASITKIMTLLLIFEELENGNLKMDEEVTTSS